MTGIDDAAGLPLRATDPTEFGRYRLLRRLGEGGMGSVYLARQSDGDDGASGALVALKVIRHDLAHDPDFRRRFRSEVARARQVPPFCTAEVLDADPDHEPPYLVVEFVDGPSLAAVVAQRGPLSPANLHGLAIGVATALTAIHGAGVIHRDLKPANVLLAPGSPKVIDFGIARGADADAATVGHTNPEQVIGTIAYMAPERLDTGAGRRLTPAADVFAWGAVVAFAGTGRPPFGAGSLEAVARILTQPPDLTGLTGSLHDLVAQALAKDPAERPTSRELLDRLLSGGAHQAAVRTDSLIEAGSRQALVSVPDAVTTRLAGEPAVPFTAPQLLTRSVSEGGPRPGGPGRIARRVGVSLLVLTVLLGGSAAAGLATGLITIDGLTGAPAASPSVSVAAGASAMPPSPSVSPSASASAAPSPSPSGTGPFETGQLVVRDSLAAPGVNWLERTSTGTELTTCTLDGALVAKRAKTGSYRCPGPMDALGDVSAAVTVTLRTPGSCAGIWFRYTDDTGGYVLRVCQDQLQLIKHGEPGKPTIVSLRTLDLTAHPLAMNEPIRVGLTAQGAHLRFYLGGSEVLNVTNSAFTLGRTVLGIFHLQRPGVTGPPPPYEVAFQDVEVRELVSQ